MENSKRKQNFNLNIKIMDKYYTIKKVNESANKKQKLEWIVALLVLTAIPCSIIVASIIIALKFSNPFKFLLT